MKKYAILFLCGVAVSLQASQKANEGAVKVAQMSEFPVVYTGAKPTDNAVERFKRRTSDSSGRFLADEAQNLKLCSQQKAEKPAPKPAPKD